MTAQLNGRWDAASFFEELTATNRLARQEGQVGAELHLP